jgi:ferredoxin
VDGCIVEIASLARDDEGRISGYNRIEQGKTDSLYYNRLWIDQSQCIRCGRCESVCPVNAITMQKVSLEA